MPKANEIPACPGAPAQRSLGRITKEYEIRLITPMFGGGVEPGEPDETMPIRATSIRGHLQFWWRATRGHLLGKGMWRREEEIFGSTEFSSPLSVSVHAQPKADLVDPSYGDKFGPIAYALFSAIENQQQVVQKGTTFRLRVAWQGEEELKSRRKAQNEQRKRDRQPALPALIEDIGTDIDIALRAWCAFGGLGSRSRRGCGAIFCEELAANVSQIPGRLFIGDSQSSGIEAWKVALNAYRNFRQSFRGKMHPKILQSGKEAIVPGRSHWPEADSIREITGSSLKPSQRISMPIIPPDKDSRDHSTPVVPRDRLPAFPRALLGMPIKFHFADGPGRDRPGEPNKDPQDVQLAPVLNGQEGLGRMSSPIITRPLWLDGKWRPGVIVLERPVPRNLCLRLTGKRAMSNGTDLSCDLAFDRIISSSFTALEPMQKCSSALEALCKFLDANGFREVTR